MEDKQNWFSRHKILTSTAGIIGFFTLMFLIAAVTGNAEVTGNVARPTTTCVDTDPAQDVYIAGTATIKASNGQTRIIKDYCQTNIKVAQYWCKRPKIDNFWGWVASVLSTKKLTTCPNGCANGVCIRPAPVCGNGVIEPGEECEIGQEQTQSCGIDIGECAIGTQTKTCTSSCTWGSWGACGGQGPVEELCDGLDNDCDGTVDNGFNVAEACTVGIGACQRTGSYVCNLQQTGTTCNVQPGEPSTEICNTIDDDCDGLIDENDVCVVLPPNCEVYDYFSSGSLDATKWTETSAQPFTDEHSIQNSQYHIAQYTQGDRDATLTATRQFLPGESFSYDVIYVSGSGNQQSQLTINGGLNYGWEPGFVCSTPSPGCSGIGTWNGDTDVGTQKGTYHVQLNFYNNLIRMNITRPDGVLFSYGIVGVAAPYKVGRTTHTGHNGIMHFDMDNFVACTAGN